MNKKITMELIENMLIASEKGDYPACLNPENKLKYCTMYIDEINGRLRRFRNFVEDTDGSIREMAKYGMLLQTDKTWFARNTNDIRAINILEQDFITKIMNMNYEILKQRDIEIGVTSQLKQIAGEVIEATMESNDVFDSEYFELELADIIISVLTLMKELNIDPTEVLEKATEKNRKKLNND